MIKLVWLLLLATLACRLLTRRWPWHWLGAPVRSKAAVRARILLGLGKSASRTDIIEAHRRLVALVHPDKGGTNEQVHEANAARDLLLGELAKQIPE
jgi:DnaJ homolog subfamily C member 19